METIRAWFRRHLREVVFVAALFLAPSLSFSAGHLANREFVHAPIIIEKCSGH